jgi:hypothetical protein
LAPASGNAFTAVISVDSPAISGGSFIASGDITAGVGAGNGVTGEHRRSGRF